MSGVTSVCPDCDEQVTLRGPIALGRLVSCPNCGARLEIVETVPVELDFADEDEEED